MFNFLYVSLLIKDYTGHHVLPRNVRLLAHQERSYLGTAPHTGVPKSHSTIRGHHEGFGSIPGEGESTRGFQRGSAPGGKRVSICILHNADRQADIARSLATHRSLRLLEEINP